MNDLEVLAKRQGLRIQELEPKLANAAARLSPTDACDLPLAVDRVLSRIAELESAQWPDEKQRIEWQKKAEAERDCAVERAKQLEAELARLTHETQWVRKKIGVSESAIVGDVQGSLHVLCSNAHGMTEYINAGKCDDKEGKIARQAVEIANLNAELAFLKSPEWTPTADNINALPEPIRRYIADLETRCDPAGDVASITIARDQLEQLQAKINQPVEPVNAELLAACEQSLQLIERLDRGRRMMDPSIPDRRFLISAISSARSYLGCNPRTDATPEQSENSPAEVAG